MSHFAATIVAMEEKPRTTPYPLRMTDELRSKLEAAAKSGSRSLHAEIVARLEESFQSKDRLRISADDVKVLLDTDENAKRIFAEQMTIATARLIKENTEAKETTLELLTAALLLAEDRRKNLPAKNIPLGNDEAVDMVRAAKSSLEFKPQSSK